jgi:chitinase
MIPQTVFRRYSPFVFLFLLILNACSGPRVKQPEHKFAVLAYYAGNEADIDKYPVEKVTHIIYSFLHLNGNQLAVDNAADSLTIRHLVALKSRNPGLKIILSLGGWGGCETCSQVFSTPAGRAEFAVSVKTILEQYQADGLDLDWEYPSIEGYPGHQFLPEDRDNFTALVQELRNVLGKHYEISFAAGGYTDYLEHSIDWQAVMPLVNYVNIMSYDLTNGYSKTTGHHAPLYSSVNMKESADRAVHYLDSLNIPRGKMVIGAAFYARIWENVENVNNGLFQPGTFKQAVDFKGMETYLHENPGYAEHWDSISQAPYYYNSDLKLFMTYDNPESVKLKTRYALNQKLGGIMFWELGCDKTENGLLEAISSEVALK